MKFKQLFATSALIAITLSPVVMAADASLSDVQKKEMEKVIHDYLVNHPEVLVEASQVLQQKQQQMMQQEAQAAIKKNANQLLSDNIAVAGNPKGSITLVEFFDYQCIHCKKMAPVLNGLTKKDNNLRIIYKELPIFGKESELASKAALAAAMQGKYQAMHDALLKQEKGLNEQLIWDTAKALNLNLAKLKTDMQSKTVINALNANRELAEKLHLMGTPAFIVAATPAGQLKEGSTPSFIPGAASEQALQELINKARAS